MPESLTRPDWRRLLSESIVSADRLRREMPAAGEGIDAVIERYPMRINPYFLSLVKTAGEPLARQVVPDAAELEENGLPAADPSEEELQSPVPHLVHRYPDRVLFLVAGQCAVYCRHCMRKRTVGIKNCISAHHIERGIDYIRNTPAVKEVLLSGGDPLLIEDAALESLLERLRRIDHVQLLRIHSRVPCVLPQRITDTLVQVLRKFHPVYINIQFNHPDELTPEAVAACGLLADAGIPLGSQTVLLRGINDSPEVMMALMRRLLASRVRPYYLHHPDPVRGTAHFRVPVETGLEIMEHLRGNLSGMGIPYYMIDLPGGGGKVPLLPDYVIRRESGRLLVKNHAGGCFTYPL